MQSVYIHIPFCHSICSYCDFPKQYYHKEKVDAYLDALEKEIRASYQQQEIKTIYIGGGTPSSLNIEQLNKLLALTKVFKLTKNYEFTFEMNIDNMTAEKLKLLFEKGVNRLSIGFETFNEKFFKYLNRQTDYDEALRLVNLAHDLGFVNISGDLMYALKDQTMADLKSDLDKILSLGLTHISIYSLIIEEKTKLFIEHEENIAEEDDEAMYKYICNYLANNGFQHYEISNFSKSRYASKHNLCYWNNEEYYGFGLGASGYLNNVRYTNTSNLNNYLNGINEITKEEITKDLAMRYEMILGLRKTSGVSHEKFMAKYQEDYLTYFEIADLIKNGYLLFVDGYLQVAPEYLYLENNFLVAFI